MSDRYYISVSQARESLRQHEYLRGAVEAFWADNGIEFPAFLRPGGYAGLARHVPTFRFEDALFTRMAEQAGLQPTWLGYEKDKFVSQSNYKRSLLRPVVTERLDKHGVPITKTQKLVKVMDWFQGKPCDEIINEDGIRIVDWHRARLLQAVPNASILDMSETCRHWGGCADNYYTAYLSLFVAHGVLFEDYHGGESGGALDGFTARVFEPAAARVKHLFGVNPLVVALPWWSDLGFYPNGDWLTNWRSQEIILQTKQIA